MANRGESLPLLPALLAAAGLFFLTAAFLSGGPDAVGGVVFGLLCWAAAAAILYRRARDARRERLKEGDRTRPASADDGPDR